MSKDEIRKILPEKKKVFTKNIKLGVIDIRDNEWDLSHNNCLSLTADKLAERVVGVEEISKSILAFRNRDYCRACELCENPPCQVLKDLAEALSQKFLILRKG